jgi:hypothetical protein
MIGPVDRVIAHHCINVARKSSCNGTTRPLAFFAARSGNCTVAPMMPVGSVTMSRVRFAISPARNPAFADSKIISLLRTGCLVEREQVVDVIVRQDLCLFTGHDNCARDPNASLCLPAGASKRKRQLASFCCFPCEFGWLVAKVARDKSSLAAVQRHR